MFIHPHDLETDPAVWRAFLVAQGFGQVACCGPAGARFPVVLPTQYAVHGDEVLFHVVAANPLVAALRAHPHAVLSVAGDWAYIPGAWKSIGSEDPRLGIPTTYYAAVQVSGPCVLVEDAEQIAALLRVQLGAVDTPDQLVDPLEHGARLRSIRGIRLRLEDVRAKFKYGGNVDVDHRLAVAAQLEARDGPGDRAALAHLRRTM
ncbi:MAG: FMN-binding negative transcriptional regulator [Acidimicrobiales bacterium]